MNGSNSNPASDTTYKTILSSAFRNVSMPNLPLQKVSSRIPSYYCGREPRHSSLLVGAPSYHANIHLLTKSLLPNISYSARLIQLSFPLLDSLPNTLPPFHTST